MHWRPFYACLVAALILLTLPMTLWSMEISESELTALETTFDELGTLNLQLENRLHEVQRLQNEALDSLLTADQSWRAYERAAEVALQATRVDRDQARREADAARAWAVAGWVGTAIAAGVAVLAVLIR